jgi:GAF domain-containing protein
MTLSSQTNEQLRELVAAGADHFGLEFGILSHIQGNDYRLIAQVSPESVLQDGDVFPLATTSCSVVLRRNDVVAQSHIAYANCLGHPCYSLFKLQTYIGVPVHIGDRVFGTLNFSSPIPYHRAFAQDDVRYMRKLAGAIEMVLLESSQSKRVTTAKSSFHRAVAHVFGGKELAAA